MEMDSGWFEIFWLLKRLLSLSLGRSERSSSKKDLEATDISLSLPPVKKRKALGNEGKKCDSSVD